MTISTEGSVGEGGTINMTISTEGSVMSTMSPETDSLV